MINFKNKCKIVTCESLHTKLEIEVRVFFVLFCFLFFAFCFCFCLFMFCFDSVFFCFINFPLIKDCHLNERKICDLKSH